MFVDAMAEGGRALGLYLSWQRVLMLTIAFFLSGAIQEFMSQGFILKYFGPKAKRWLSYLVASVSGIILSVCSCSVLPMFASIRRRGAGLGPAITFLFAGPAINILAITLTFDLGVDIAMARIIGAVCSSVVIGLLMYFFFRKSEVSLEGAENFSLDEEKKRSWWQNGLFFLTMILMMFSGFKGKVNIIITIALLAFLILQLFLFFSWDELKSWSISTWYLVKKIVPLFLVGVFLAGMITYALPQEVMLKLVGKNTLQANAFSAVFAAFMYFATLTEIPIVQSFMNLGMNKGCAVAMLLAGPSLSLPNMFVIGKVLGSKKTITYILIVVLISTLIGFFSGLIFAA